MVRRLSYLGLAETILDGLHTKELRRAALDEIDDPMYRELIRSRIHRIWKKRRGLK